jgi:hypothetical protein
MARKRKTFKEAVKTDAGYASWMFGDNVRDVDHDVVIAKRVSEALKNVSQWTRREAARKFANRMWNAAARVREEGCHKAGMPYPARLPRAVINAMCWGVSDGHAIVMIKRYEAAAKAAERFCKARPRR